MGTTYITALPWPHTIMIYRQTLSSVIQ